MNKMHGPAAPAVMTVVVFSSGTHVNGGANECNQYARNTMNSNCNPSLD